MTPEGSKSLSQVAKGLGIDEACLRNCVTPADIDEGRREGLATAERDELAKLRKENRVLKMRRDILSRAAAFFAAENVLPPRH